MTMQCHDPAWPDDGPVEPSGSGYFRGVVHGALGCLGALAAIVWVATMVAGRG